MNGLHEKKTMHTCIRMAEIPKEERPREKFAKGGPTNLSDAELIAILLCTGTRGKSAIHIGQDLLKSQGSLVGLSRCSIQELMNSVPGVGLAKATQLATVFELAKRCARGTEARPKVEDAEAVFELLSPEMQALSRESLRVILLDSRYGLLRIEEVSQGTINESLIHPREVFRPAFVHAAYGVIVVHNHPSGDPFPSESDCQLTKRLFEAAKLLQIKLIDHVIIGTPDGGRAPYFSFREIGIIV